MLRPSDYLSQFRLQLSLGLHQLLAAPAEGLVHSGALDSQILCGVLQDALCQSPDTTKRHQNHTHSNIEAWRGTFGRT